MTSEFVNVGQFIVGMKAAYSNGENAMEYARKRTKNGDNLLAATLIAYDLQAGTYVKETVANPSANLTWCEQLAGLIRPYLPAGGSVLEVGTGEATTLAGVLGSLADVVGTAIGFDVSWSRVDVGRDWLKSRSINAELFVASLFNVPLRDDSVDVVYSSHSLEPNGGREEEAIRECLRVARRAVVLVEPIYELASEQAQNRMRHHGYVQGLREAAERLGAKVELFQLLDHCSNPLNPSGTLVLSKAIVGNDKNSEQAVVPAWQCPLTGAALTRQGDHFIARDTGIAYPTLSGIPLLRPEHSVVAFNLAR